MFGPRTFAVAIIALALGALAFRLVGLENRPMHADEAVQAARSRNLWLKGEYRYDADEFHGPTLNYATLPALWGSGAKSFAETDETTYRCVPAVFGAAAIVLLLLLADGLGILWAALFLAVSPAMFFYSRYYIHETLLAFFSLAAMGCAWRAVRNEGRTRRWFWWIAAGLAVGLMQATKETAVLSYAAAVGAAIAMWAMQRWLPTNGATLQHSSALCLLPSALSPRPARVWLTYALPLLVAASMAVAVALVLFTSFLTNLDGARDAVKTYLPWLRRAGGESPHIQPWHFYLTRLFWWQPGDGSWWSESLLGVLAAIGFLASLFRPRWLGSANVGLVRWLGCYTLLLMAIYSVIPYKTPWCLLQFLLPLVLLAGVGAAVLVRCTPRWPAKALVALLILAAASQLAWQAHRASFVLPADPKNPYVYAHTPPNVLKLAAKLDELLTAAPDGPATPVAVIWSDHYYWPLPWYLRGFERVGYWTKLPDEALPPIVICSPDFDKPLTARLDATHLMVDFYGIRPDALGMLWVRMDLWEEHLRRKGRL